MSLDNQQHAGATDLPPEAGRRGLLRSGAGILLDAFRIAATNGLNRKQIVAALACWGNDQESTEVHTEEIDEILSYLCGVGVVRVYGNRWFAVSGREMLRAPAGGAA